MAQFEVETVPLLKITEVAKIFRTNSQRIREIVAAGELRAIRWGKKQFLFRPDDIERFLKSHEA